MLAIPKNWDSKWFRDIVSNLLQGGDVRNAVGANGIVVSGNISSPYATIGFAAPVNLPGPVTITDASPGTVALTIIPASGQNALNILAAAGQAATISLAGNGATAANGFQLGQNSAGTAFFGNNGSTWATLDGNGRWVFNAPNAGGQSNFTFNGRNGNNVLAIVQAAGLGTAFGVMIQAGTNNADYALLVQSQGGGATYYQVRGDGAIGFHGVTPVGQTTGFGTPVGGAVVANYNITDAGGANSNTNKCVAEILTILKGLGLIGA